jgi:hypothetical protein
MALYHYFRSENVHGVFAFTDERSGAPLPPDYRPWTRVAEFEGDAVWKHAASKGAVMVGVAENGFSLWGVETHAQPSQQLAHHLIESDRVEGTDVYDRGHSKVGSIKRLLIEKMSGRVLYVEIAFGGFLGLGIHHQVIPWERLSYDLVLGGYSTQVSEEELRRAPAFLRAGNAWPTPRQEQEIQEYWRET